MKYHLICLFIVSFCFVDAQIPEASFGTIIQYKDFKSDHIPSRNVDVWLPQDYEENKKYAVIYMHDGSSLFDKNINWNNQEWEVDETLNDLVNRGIIQDCIVVSIWNGGANRQSEYFPQKAFDLLDENDKLTYSTTNFYNSNQAILGTSVNSDNYLRFIVQELKPFIDTTYAVYTDPKHTIIAGSSYGGLISLYGICEYDDIFGKAICMSTHWTGIFDHNSFITNAILTYLETNLPDPRSHSIYFDHGTVGLDTLYGVYQEKVDELMVEKGYSDENWMSRVFKGANHTETAWSDRLHIPLTFMLGIERK